MNGDCLDDFEDLSAWTAIASGQARLAISPERGRRGGAMRLDFDFQGGGGFVVARKPFALTLPESYAFSFDIRGRGPSNILEFKLVDASNQNVWRWRVEAFDLPEDWQTRSHQEQRDPVRLGAAGRRSGARHRRHRAGDRGRTGRTGHRLDRGPALRGHQLLPDPAGGGHQRAAGLRAAAMSGTPPPRPAGAARPRTSLNGWSSISSASASTAAW